MKLAIDIVQSLLLPKLEKDARFDINQTNIAFWEAFTTAFLDFEKDAKPVYAAIYSLELENTEKIISKLDTVYSAFIKELAENHVLGISSEAIDYLITSKNSAFEKEVLFFTDLKNAITKVERKRIKKELPNAYDKLSFVLSDDSIALAITKKEREALKEKMNSWDKELAVTEETPVYSVSAKKETKVISLSWIKYAAAACLVLGLGVWFYTNQNQGIVTDTNVVTAPNLKDTVPKNGVIPNIPSEALAEVTTVRKNSTVIEEGMGMTGNSILIIENNQQARKESIINSIEKYQKLLEKEFTINKVSNTPISKELKIRIDRLNNELNLLNEREQKYLFDGKVLTLYVSIISKENRILAYKDNYYLVKDTVFYTLTTSGKLQSYKKVTDNDLLTALNEIMN
jgi:hypothetical protein